MGLSLIALNGYESRGNTFAITKFGAPSASLDIIEALADYPQKRGSISPISRILCAIGGTGFLRGGNRGGRGELRWTALS